MAFDPTTPLGKVRLNTSDISEPYILSDDYINQALTDSSNNVAQATKQCLIWILGILTKDVHKRMSVLEIWGSERFNQYLKFVNMQLTNPNTAMIGMTPIVYGGGIDADDVVANQEDYTIYCNPLLNLTRGEKESDNLF